MRRWPWLIIAAVLLSVPLIPTTVSADSSAEVVVTATGYICEAPGGFTVTYISDYEVGLNWAKGEGAENTMVRAAIGRLPENREDGYLVYYGDGTYATDWVNMETLSERIFYRTWAQNAAGVWEEGETTGFTEGVGMILIALITLGLGFIVLAYAFKRMEMFFAAAGAWGIMGFYEFTKSTSPSPTEITDIHMALFWVGMALIIACSMLAMANRPRKEDEVDDGLDTGEREIKGEFDEIRKDRERHDEIFGGKRRSKPTSRYED